MAIDKVALGRQGECFVMRKLLDRGWKFPDNPMEMHNKDWCFEKNGRQISVQVKTSTQMKFSLTEKPDFDYMIFTDLKDIYIIPREMLRFSNRMTKQFKRLKDSYELLELSGKDLLDAINDRRIMFCEFDTSGLLSVTTKIIEESDKNGA